MALAFSSEQSYLNEALTISQTSSCQLSTTKTIQATFSGTTLSFRVGTWDGSSLSWGSASTISSVASNNMSLVALDDTRFVAVYYKTNQIVAAVGTESSGSITFGTELQILSSSNINGYFTTVKVDTDKVICSYAYYASNYSTYQVALSISDTTITKGSQSVVKSWGSSMSYISTMYPVKIDTNKWVYLHRYQADSSYIYLSKKYSVSGTTISETTMSSDNQNVAYTAGRNINAVALDTNKILVAYKASSDSYIKGYVVTVGASSYTWSSSQSITSNTDDKVTDQDILLQPVSTTKARIVYNYSTSNYRRVKNINISDTTITTDAAVNYENAMSSGAILTPLSSDAFRLIYKDYDSPYYVKYCTCSEAYNKETSISGTITLSSSFSYSWEEAGNNYIASGSIDLSSSFSTSATYDYSSNADGSISSSSAFSFIIGEERNISGEISVSSSFTTIVDIIEEVLGEILLTSDFSYTSKPEYVKTITGTISSSSSFNYYFYEYGPVDPYFNKEVNRTDSCIKETFCWLSANKVLRLFTQENVLKPTLYGQFIDIDANKNITSSTKTVIYAADLYNIYLPNTKIIKVKNNMVVFNIDANRIVSLTIDQTNNTFGGKYNYAIQNTGESGATYFFTHDKYSWDVFDNNTKIEVLYYAKTNGDAALSYNRVANGVINANNSITWAYQTAIPEFDNGELMSLQKIREDAFIYYTSLSNKGVAQIELGNCVPYSSSISTTYWHDPITLSDNRVIAKSNTNKYRIYTVNSTTISQSSEFDFPTNFKLDLYTRKISSTTLLDISEENSSVSTPLTSKHFANLWHVMPNGSIQGEKQLISTYYIPNDLNYGDISLISAYDETIGLFLEQTGTTPTESYIPASFNNTYNYSSTVNGSMTLSSSSEVGWGPDYIREVDGEITLSSSSVFSLHYDRDGDGGVELSSSIDREVGYIPIMEGEIILSSSSLYEEWNNYPINGDGAILLSSSPIIVNNFDYLTTISGTITASSEDLHYPEEERVADGELLLSSSFTFEKDVNYTALIECIISSSTTTEIGGPVFVTEANGEIVLTGNFICMANSFEWAANGELILSSSSVVVTNYGYLYTADGLVDVALSVAIQRDFNFTANGLITSSALNVYYPGEERDANGELVISSDTNHAQDEYYTFANGVISSSSGAEYEAWYGYDNYIGIGEITLSGYFPEEVTTYKYDVVGEITLSSSMTYSWLADSKEVVRVSSLINREIRVGSYINRKIIVQGRVNKNIPVTSKL